MKKRPVGIFSRIVLLAVAGCAGTAPQEDVRNCLLDYQAMQAKEMVDIAILPLDSCRKNPEVARRTMGFLEVARRMAAGVPVLGQ
jgi:hypothetical protein